MLAAFQDPEVAAELAAILQRARLAHARVKLDDATFLDFLASKLPGDGRVREALHALDVAALYLTCACANGDAAALEEVEISLLPKLDGPLARAGAKGHAADEVKQRLRERLFTASAGGAPRIVEYSGRGDLGRWLRAVAVRIAIDLGRREKKSTDTELDDLAFDVDDPELLHLKDRYRATVRAAMCTAFTRLDDEARGDLRLYYIEGLRLVDLAALRRVAVSTMSRRLQAARETVLTETRKNLASELGLGSEELESLLVLVQSRLDLSRQWLGT